MSVTDLHLESAMVSRPDQAGAGSVRKDRRSDRRFADTDLQYDRTPYFQDGIYKGCNEQVPMACGSRTRQRLYKSGITWGRPLCSRGEWIKRLFENGQVATQYCDPEGNISMNEEWNVNGSYCAIEGITSRTDVSSERWLILNGAILLSRSTSMESRT